MVKAKRDYTYPEKTSPTIRCGLFRTSYRVWAASVVVFHSKFGGISKNSHFGCGTRFTSNCLLGEKWATKLDQKADLPKLELSQCTFLKAKAISILKSCP